MEILDGENARYVLGFFLFSAYLYAYLKLKLIYLFKIHFFMHYRPNIWKQFQVSARNAFLKNQHEFYVFYTYILFLKCFSSSEIGRAHV